MPTPKHPQKMISTRRSNHLESALAIQLIKSNLVPHLWAWESCQAQQNLRGHRAIQMPVSLGLFNLINKTSKMVELSSSLLKNLTEMLHTLGEAFALNCQENWDKLLVLLFAGSSKVETLTWDIFLGTKHEFSNNLKKKRDMQPFLRNSLCKSKQIEMRKSVLDCTKNRCLKNSA